jgi:hypothetical protein
MTNYAFNWKLESVWFVVTFAVFFGSAFVATEGMAIDDWRAWLVATLTSAARVAVAGAVVSLARWLTASRGEPALGE